MKNLTGHVETVKSVHFWKENTHLLSAGKDKTIKIWDISKGESIMSNEHPETLNCAFFSPDYTIIASVCLDHKIRIWELKADFSVTIKYTLGDHGKEINRICFSWEGDKLISCSDDHTLILWDLTKGIAFP